MSYAFSILYFLNTFYADSISSFYCIEWKVIINKIWVIAKCFQTSKVFFPSAASNGKMGLTLFDFFDLLLQLLMSGHWMFSDSLWVLHTGHKDHGEGQNTVNFESSFSTSHCLLWDLARFLKYWSRKAILVAVHVFKDQ